MYTNQRYQMALMDEGSALLIVNWKYEEPYAIYNMSDDSYTEAVEEIEELMDDTYFSVSTSDNELIGFFCYGQNAQVPGGKKLGFYEDKDILDIGLGLRPDLTGKGNGYDLLLTGLEFGQQKYAPTSFRLSVASFNHRAIALYNKAGFKPKETFINIYGNQKLEFLIMERTELVTCGN